MADVNFMQMLQAIIDNDRKVSSEDEGGVVQVPAIAFWTSLFSQFFLHSNTNEYEDDDMLFYVKKDPKQHKDKPELKVFRKTSDKMPGLGDPFYDWSETVYLNMLLLQVQYTLTCAICSRTSGELDIRRRVTQKVYASPSAHNMEAKSSSSEMSYPNIFFTIDSFDEVWEDLYLSIDEEVCVEIIAHDKDKTFESIVFLGSVKYDLLLKTVDKKRNTGASWVEKMSMGLFKQAEATDKHFVRMKGPGGKGYAEMAVEKCEMQHKSNAPVGLVARRVLPTSKSDPLSLHSKLQSSNQYEETSTSTEHTGHGIQSTPDLSGSNVLLKTHLTFVTLPWHKITLDILRDYETPSERKPPVLRK